MKFSPAESATLLSAIQHLESMKAQAGFLLKDENGDEVTFSCAYRSDRGPCVVGFLIPEEKYQQKIEGNSMRYKSPVWELMTEIFPAYSVGFFDTLTQLQALHDNAINWNNSGFYPIGSQRELMEKIKSRLNLPLDNRPGI